jgi:hypothetical protein
MERAPTKHRDVSPDRDDRIADFLARHGGKGAKAPSDGDLQGGTAGWSEVYAADGHTLRCDWSRLGTEEKMTYSEIAPGAGR